MIALILALALSAPNPLDPPPANLPKASRYELDNGLRVVLIPNRSVPWLEVRLAFRVGSASEPSGKEGVAGMVGTLLSGGVPGLDEQAFAEALARLGGSIQVDCDARAFTIAGQVTTLDPEGPTRFLELFRAAALEATLPDSVLQRQKTLLLAQLAKLRDVPEALANVAIRAAVLAGHAEGRATFGTPASTQAMTRADLLSWRERALVPEHAVLIVGGAFDEPAMLALLNDKFGRWKTSTTCEVTKSALPDHCAKLCRDGACLDNPIAELRFRPPHGAGPQPPVLLVTVDDPTMTQVQWRYGVINPFAVMHPRWGAFRLGTHVLGGEYTARLNAILRVKEGLTYGAYISPDFGGHESGVMTIETDATPQSLVRSIKIGVGEYHRLAREAVPAAELESMRATLINGFPFRFETISDVVGQYLFVELANIPYRWLATYTEEIARFSAADVREAFATAMAADQPHLVVVGPAALEPLLAGLKMGPVRVLSAADFLDNGL